MPLSKKTVVVFSPPRSLLCRKYRSRRTVSTIQQSPRSDCPIWQPVRCAPLADGPRITYELASTRIQSALRHGPGPLELTSKLRRLTGQISRGAQITARRRRRCESPTPLERVNHLPYRKIPAEKRECNASRRHALSNAGSAGVPTARFSLLSKCGRDAHTPPNSLANSGEWRRH